MRFALLQLLLFFPLILTVNSQPPQSNDDNNTNNNKNSDFLRTTCSTTLYPDLCFSSLSSFSSSIHKDPALLARAAIAVTLSNTLNLTSYLSNLTTTSTTLSNDAVLHDCFENLKDAVGEMKDSIKQMREVDVSSGSSVQMFRFKMSNVQTWLSAALTDEETCTDGFDGVSNEMKDEVCGRVNDVKKLTSNALALVNHYVDCIR